MGYLWGVVGEGGVIGNKSDFFINHKQIIRPSDPLP